MHKNLYKSGSYSVHNSYRYRVSIQILLSGLSVFIYDPEEDICVLREEFPIKVSSASQIADVVSLIQSNSPIFQTQYNRVVVEYVTNGYTLVPAKYFSNKSQNSLLSLLKGDKLDESVISKNISGKDIYLLFSMPSNLIDLFNKIYHNVEIVHQSNSLLSYCSKSLYSKGSSVNIRIRDLAIDLVVFDRGTVLLATTYHCESDEDILFYILSIYETLNLDREQILTSIYYNSDKISELISILDSYIRNITYTPELDVCKMVLVEQN